MQLFSIKIKTNNKIKMGNTNTTRKYYVEETRHVNYRFVESYILQISLSRAVMRPEEQKLYKTACTENDHITLKKILDSLRVRGAR